MKDITAFCEANHLELLHLEEGKATLRCSVCGEEFSMTVKNLLYPHPKRQYGVCPRCSSEQRFRAKLIDLYGRIPYSFETEFKGYEEPLKVKCLDCGHEWTAHKAKILLLNAKLPDKAHPCEKCTDLRNYGSKDISELKQALIEAFGSCDYEFPKPEEYRGLYSQQKMTIVCKLCGHRFMTHPWNILHPSNGRHYCSKCNNLLKRSLPYKEHCLAITNGAIEPLEEPRGSKVPIKHKCNICGYGSDGSWLKVPIKNTAHGAGCPKCSKITTRSRAEKEILKLLKENYAGTIRHKDTSVLNGQELDIYLPELKLAFEIDGLYWHSEGYKGKAYHLNKTEECYKAGVRLIHIFDDEWYQKKDIVSSKILNIVGCNKSARIYARACSIQDVPAKEKNAFLNSYHIQGEDKAAISKGLYYNGDLVAVMTMAKLRKSLGNKSSKDGVYELSRFATCGHVVGGFSRLFTAILREHPDIHRVSTFADLRWSDRDNNVYLKNGFSLNHISPPNYWYFNKNASAYSARRYHRYNFRKGVLQEKFPKEYDPSLTEFEIMDKTAYRRIWDCGNLVYSYVRDI